MEYCWGRAAKLNNRAVWGRGLTTAGYIQRCHVRKITVANFEKKTLYADEFAIFAQFISNIFALFPGNVWKSSYIKWQIHRFIRKDYVEFHCVATLHRSMDDGYWAFCRTRVWRSGCYKQRLHPSKYRARFCSVYFTWRDISDISSGMPLRTKSYENFIRFRRLSPLNCKKNEYLGLALRKETAVQAFVCSIVSIISW